MSGGASLLYFLHPCLLLIALTFAILARRSAAIEWRWIVLVLGAAYLLGLTEVCIKPYWIDNEVPEFIEWPTRLFWGLPGASVAAIILLPAWAAVRIFFLRWRRSR